MRVPLITQLQYLDREIFIAEINKPVNEDELMYLYHKRAEVKDKHDWIMDVFRR